MSNTTQTQEKPPIVSDEEIDEAVVKLQEAKAEAKAQRKAEKKAARAEKREHVAESSKAVGRALIDTDLRDMGHGFQRAGRFVGRHVPRVRIVRPEGESTQDS